MDAPARLIRIFSPGMDRVKTFRSANDVISVGSGASADLSISLPALAPEHLRIDFAARTLTALGPDVLCDGRPVPVGTATPFTDDSIFKLRALVLGFYTTAGNKELHIPRLKQAASSPIHPPAPAITQNGGVNTDRPSEPDRTRDIERIYKQPDTQAEYSALAGDVSRVPPLKTHNSEETSKAIKSTGKALEDPLSAQKAEEGPAEPSASVRKEIERRLEENNETIAEALEVPADATVTPQEKADLGKVAIDHAILEGALNGGDGAAGPAKAGKGRAAPKGKAKAAAKKEEAVVDEEAEAPKGKGKAPKKAAAKAPKKAVGKAAAAAEASEAVEGEKEEAVAEEAPKRRKTAAKATAKKPNLK